MRLIDRLRAVLAPPEHLLAPLLARLAALEARVAPLEEMREQEVERDLRWAEMNAQLRRYLGRLDAHRQHSEERENGSAPGRHGPRPDVLAAKFPHGVPTKE